MAAKKSEPNADARKPEQNPDAPPPVVTNTYTAEAKTPVWDKATQGEPPKVGDYVVVDSAHPAPKDDA